ncbi:Midasin (Dynein-related AAA-ATPase MDN1) (MIDAS-containing protein) [Durusdinium trenchii]|uniref:Midasin (Dynein-related AAA-ATPase MDN1) (MIDAS-containing protein) n=1 Tax=Durusdinium trenchii TaxID=1381693 RepID=A0ABP0NT68_9DINO
MSGEAPRTRHRSKSAPRGRSPAPKALKKASKAAGLVTPPPRPTRGGSGSSKEESSARRKISFKEAPKVTPIIAEYKAGGSNISEKEADEVFQAIKAKETKKKRPKDAKDKDAKKAKKEEKESKKDDEQKNEAKKEEKERKKDDEKKSDAKKEEKKSKKGDEKKSMAKEEEKKSKKGDEKKSEAKEEGKKSKEKDEQKKSKKGVEKKSEAKEEEKKSKEKQDEKKSKKGDEKKSEVKEEEKKSKAKEDEKNSKKDDEKKSEKKKKAKEDGKKSEANKDERKSKAKEDKEESEETEDDSSCRVSESSSLSECSSEDSSGEGGSHEVEEEDDEEQASDDEEQANKPTTILKNPALNRGEADEEDEEDDSDQEEKEEEETNENDSEEGSDEEADESSNDDEPEEDQEDEDDVENSESEAESSEEAPKKGVKRKAEVKDRKKQKKEGPEEKSQRKDKEKKKKNEEEEEEEEEEQKTEETTQKKKKKKSKESKGEDGVRNSSTHRKEWQAYGRWLKNKRRCPAKIIAATKDKETRDKIFLEYLDCGCNFAEVEARFEQKLEESQRTQVRWGFRNDQTIPDPEFPGEDEHLYFVMVELNLDDIRELKRVTSLELQGTLDPAGLKAFVEAGGCLDGKQHLALGDLAGKACAVKLDAEAEQLQGMIHKKLNRNKDYVTIIARVEDIKKVVTERLSLAKALVRASEKPVIAAADGCRDAKQLVADGLDCNLAREMTRWHYGGVSTKTKLVIILQREAMIVKDESHDRIGEIIGYITDTLDILHVFHQGVASVVIPSLICHHLEEKHPGLTLKEMDTYLSSEVYRHYRGWCRKQGAPANGCSFRFSASRYGKETWMSYPELGSIYKAACTKGMLYWAASFLKESATTVPGGDLRYRTILAFTRFQHLIDSHGPFLGESGTKDVVNVGRQAYDGCYQDEDLMKEVGRIASRTHVNTLEKTTLSRYRAYLQLFVHANRQ